MKDLFFYCSIILLTTAGCLSDNTENNKKLIQGTWVFEKGTRNGNEKDTEILESLTFDFNENYFSCDLLPEMLPGLESKEEFEIKEDVVMVAGIFKIKIINLEKLNLQLEFELKNGAESEVFNLSFNKKSST